MRSILKTCNRYHLHELLKHRQCAIVVVYKVLEEVSTEIIPVKRAMFFQKFLQSFCDIFNFVREKILTKCLHYICLQKYVYFGNIFGKYSCSDSTGSISTTSKQQLNNSQVCSRYIWPQKAFTNQERIKNLQIYKKY